MTENEPKNENIHSRIILEETFYVLTKKNSIFRVRLNTQGLCLIKESDNQVKEQTIPLKDIIGCRCLRSKKKAGSCVCQSLPRSQSLKVVDANSGERDDTDTSVYLYVYAYVLQQSKGNVKKRERTIITLRFRSFDKYEDNNREAQRWRTAIKCLLSGKVPDNVPSMALFYNQNNHHPLHHRAGFGGGHPRPGTPEPKLLVLLNPKSGSGKGRVMFHQKVAPILQEAEVQYDLHITKYANYAREFVRTCDNLQHWKGILMVGGDGIMFEVINGIFERWDWEECIRNVPLGIIPGGSGNGLARSICHHTREPYFPQPTLAAALSAVRNQNAPMDLVRIETKSQIMFSFLSCGWGLLSDIDIESESLRAIGGQRFTIWSVARLLTLRTYGGKVWYLPANATPPSPIVQPHAEDDCEIPSEVHLETAGDCGRQRLDSWYSAASRRSAYFSTTGSSYQSTADENLDNGDVGDEVDGDHLESKPRMYGPASQIPALTAPVPAHWTLIEGRFIMVHAAYQTHIGDDCFFAPDSSLNDGIIWLLVIRAGTTRGQLLQFLLGLSNGTHLQVPCNDNRIEMIAVKAFRIEPDLRERGYITVDGEHVEYGPIQAEIFPSLAKVMVP